MIEIEKIQRLLKEYAMDGWIFTDFHGRDEITRSFLSLSERPATRRLFYIIYPYGEPVKILSAIEPLLLDHLPGERRLYMGKEALKDELKKALLPGGRYACQYSPEGNVPVVSTMDAGTLEFLRSFHIEPVSSANLLQYFGAVLTKKQIDSHIRAGEFIHQILDDAFLWLRSQIDSGQQADEWLLLQKLKALIKETPLVMEEPPFLGVDEHASDPGYEPVQGKCKAICEGSRLIIDIAGKLPDKDAIYYDISWCMYVGKNPNEEYVRLFNIVWEAREAVRAAIAEALSEGRLLKGCEADALTRHIFEKYGMSAFIKHRTGHNIGCKCHGTGTNLDDFETHDDRYLIPGTMFSVEPGLYTENYGVRLEYDVYITPEKEIKIFGPVQNEILCI